LNNRPIAYLGGTTLLTMTKFGRNIYVDSRDLSLAPHILMRGDWESWITAFFQRRILARRDDPKGALIIDVGANFGWYSLLAYFTREGHYDVVAFEPNPVLHSLLQKTFSVNGMPIARAMRLAVGAAAGVATLKWEDECMGGGGIADESDYWNRTDVEVLTLDWFLGKEMFSTGAKPPVAMIKIDVEGMEPEVIVGAHEIIRANPSIDLLVEHHQSDQEPVMLEWLRGEGFQLWSIGEDQNLHVQTLESVAKLRDAEMLFLTR